MNSENDNDKVDMPSFLSPEPTVSYSDDLDYFKDFEKEFPAIVYNDAQTSKLDFLTEPTVSIRRILGNGYGVSTFCTVLGPRERNIDEYWWRIYKSGDLEVLES
ncbi:hypothetical protein Tco_0617130 [Tanacetum coccineum]